MWHFRKMARAEINQDPTQEDFFNTEHLPDFADALVRESIQNSLDAGLRDTGEPVRVRIALPSLRQRPPVKEISPFFNNLFRHVSASGVVRDQPAEDSPLEFLVFEDFGTRGLVGDPRLSDDPEGGEGVDFYYFWRNVGRAGKRGDERGRWGLGKTMFPAASRLHSFFGLTVRNDDARKLLMGQSVLSIHHVDGEKRYPYGWFGEPDGEGADQFILPVEDLDTLSKFSELFELTRTTESGLSVVIPYPRGDLEQRDLVRSVILHYFFPILSGELVVEISGPDGCMEVTDGTISEHWRRFGTDGDGAFGGTLCLARRFLYMNSKDFVHASDQRPHRSPGWSEDLFTSNELDRIAESMDAGESVAVRVPVNVIPRGDDVQRSYFDLVIERDNTLDGAVDEFIRSGITISGIHSLRESGVRALVVIRDRPLAEMLGDAENPAHTEWQERSRNFRGKYSVGPSTLQFVRDAPRQFLRMLNRRSEEIDDTGLRHVFPNLAGVNRPERSTTVPGTERKPKVSPQPDPDVPRRPRLLKITRTSDGFRVGLTEEGQTRVPLELRIRAGYDTRRGNPLKRWTAADFDFDRDPHRPAVTGGEVISGSGNSIKVRADSSEFRVDAGGFDRERDLVLDVKAERNSDETTV